MKEFKIRITNKNKTLIKKLFNTEHLVHEESLFWDNLFKIICQKIEDKNKIQVMLDIIWLIVSSMKILITYDVSDLECLIKTNNEDWNNSISFYSSYLQSDYSVKFKWSAFMNNQLEKLKSFINNWNYIFFLMIMNIMHFLFLTCEMKCDEMMLEIVNRQNAHNMTLVMRDVVKLFRLVKHEQELHQKILAFSILYDHCSVRIYDHYSVINEKNTIFYCYLIHEFSFMILNDKEKWTAYKFIRNIYNNFMSMYLKRICWAIDQLFSDLNFDIL